MSDKGLELILGGSGENGLELVVISAQPCKYMKCTEI